MITRNWENIKSRYGLTQEDFLRLMQSQDYACAICKQRSYALSVDHNHETGKVRALLCSACNKFIGFARENPDILQNAKQYLLAQNGIDNN